MHGSSRSRTVAKPGDGTGGGSILGWIVILMAGAFPGTGCGPSDARLTGTVTVGGRAAAGALVEARAAGRVATGAVLADGSLRMDYGTWPGLEPGPCRIDILFGGDPAGGPAAGEQGAVARSARQRRVSCERTLVAGDNRFDLDLDDRLENGPGD